MEAESFQCVRRNRANFLCNYEINITELITRKVVAVEYASNGLLPPSLRSILVKKRYFLLIYNRAIQDPYLFSLLLDGWRGDLSEVWIDDNWGDILSAGEALERTQMEASHIPHNVEKWIMLVSPDLIKLGDLIEILGSANLRMIVKADPAREVRLSESPTSHPLILYPLGTDPASPEDPTLIKMLGESFGESILGWSCFVFRYRDVTLARSALKTCLEGLREHIPSIQVDFGSGTTLSGNETLEWFLLEPDWDWNSM